MDFCKAEITKNPSIKENVRKSMLDRLKWLNQESITSSIIRLIRQRLPDDREAENIFREAYEIRGAVLHSGQTNADLEELSRKMEKVMRRVFESYLNITKSVEKDI